MTASVERSIDVSSFNPPNACYTQWWEETELRGYKHYRSARWATEKEPRIKMFEEFNVLGSSLGYEIFDVFFEKDSVLIRLTYQNGSFGIFLSSEKKEDAVPVETWLRDMFPKTKPKTDDTVNLKFWFHNPQDGGSRTNRVLSVPKWEDIRSNYGTEVQEELDKLTASTFRPSHGGQLILWQGPPGTGKTFAIRALVREWVKWCDSAYIIDPEAFLNDANYMMQAMLHQDRQYVAEDDYEEGYLGEEFENVTEETAADDEEDAATPQEREEVWRLLIIEDAGELLTHDAKYRSAQAFSRLLNIADGILGQGLKVLVLITTNEEVKDLHEAVSRPGRCASHIIFPDLTKDEANAWLEAKGKEQRVTKDTSLAELFGEVDGFRIKDNKRPEKRTIGFGRG